MAAAAASTSASAHPAAAPDFPPPPPPLHTTAPRPRRRAREVSSRYLSTPAPLPSSSPRLSTSSSRASSPTPSPRAHTRVATPFANENQPPIPPPTLSRRRAVQKLFGEIGAGANPRASVSSSAAGTATPRFLPRSTSGPTPATARRGYPRPPTPARASSCPSATDDAASCCSTDSSSTLTDFSEPDGIPVSAAPCESPPLLGPASCRGGGRLSSELRSSVPEPGGSTRGAIPLCHRSLNSALTGCQAPPVKLLAPPRPPQPHGAKVPELKKAVLVGGRKVAGKQEDVHQLRMLDNRHVQYRFLNARAKAVAKAKAAVAESSLFGLAERISGLRESVSDKRAEAEKIKRDQRLFSIVGSQVPYLDLWSDVEEDYSSCLTGATSALHNASLRLPIVGGVRVNCEEISEILNSAVQLLEPASPCVQNLLPKVEEVDCVASNLAQVIASERALIEECGNLLNQAHHMQMREYSLRSHLMQLKS
uniref:Uncharacterized protein n=1 Tax=Avena sativa TaxID=4498 RepID=A0ACD5YJ56_AVESA